ncbi:adenine-specific methyltransferase EcoRI family protein [Treponema endosymbiont of Eucomonympha sp.]|uniref:adenine-specific methyltransferase EcoRI family protein n=1 Tax=Treponema endosymbiont of Eucomonympha sp. TaxID=1580831 RepID=UPI000B15A390|nr:adenine-specific methyltransferase EcoRI family protein [Treponema endosymbiont of Eucomonympha sp.]
MAEDKIKQYIYIVQASLEPSKCKIGKTNDLERRLKEYNNMTGKSKENTYQYLFAGEVKNMAETENDIKEKYLALREEKSKEIYFYNSALFKDYVQFIKSHSLFVKETFIKADDKKQIVKIVKKTTPSLEERGLSQRDVMQKAQKVNNDEFYTRLEDVEKELSLYDKSIWKNKTVFCNCDDAVDDDERNTSAFALYFLQNFKELELKKLICTHYSGAVDLFNQGAKGYVFTKDGFSELKDYPKNYTGSFDAPLSLKILTEETDIVCTNPPFSRAIDYWKVTIGSGKKFLIISNISNVITKSFIPFFYENKVWAGYNEIDWFLTPKKELTRAAGYWYTNISIKDRPKYKQLKIMPLKDIPAKYKKYDDSKILLVDNCYIPDDYTEAFAVSARPILNGLLEKGYKLIEDKEYYPYINGKKRFARVLVQKV